jgi:hypothetical protein
MLFEVGTLKNDEKSAKNEKLKRAKLIISFSYNGKPSDPFSSLVRDTFSMKNRYAIVL